MKVTFEFKELCILYFKCCFIEYTVIGDIEVLQIFNQIAFARVGDFISFFGLSPIKLFGWLK